MVKGMAKSRLVAAIPVLFAIEGAFLVIYGLATGAEFLAVFSVFLGGSSSLSVKEFYVLLGLVRTILAIGGITEVKSRGKIIVSQGAKRAAMIVIGILFVFFSVSGIVICMIDGDISAPGVYGAVTEFIITFSLSLFYLISAFQQAKS